MSNLSDEITRQSSVTVPEAALKIELNENLVRYLFFKTVTDDTISFQSNITDNWVENNTAIQDHITISPVTITMRGLIGELFYTSEQAQRDYERALAQANYENSKGVVLADFGDFYKLRDDGKLSAISAYFPEVSNVTQMAQNMWDRHEASQRKAKKISNILTGQANNSLTVKMEDYSGLTSNVRTQKLKEVGESLKDYWINRKAFIANTPFGDFDNMYIQSVTLHQGNENFIGEIDITLKQLRFAETLTTEADKDVLAKYNAYAQAKEQDNGKAGGENTMLADLAGLAPGVGVKR